MKSTLLLLTFSLLAFSAKCDTLDFWHVYLNDSLIGAFSILSEEPQVAMDPTKFTAKDSLVVRYGCDHPCHGCTHTLTVFAEIMEELPKAQTTDPFGRLAINLREIQEISRRHNISTFRVMYGVGNSEFAPDQTTFLFLLKLSE